MSGSHVLVTFGDITAMSSRLASEGEAIGGQLDALLASVRSMVESGWQGQAALAFEDLYANATAAWREIETALVGMGGLLDNVAARYEEQEASLVASFSG